MVICIGEEADLSQSREILSEVDGQWQEFQSQQRYWLEEFLWPQGAMGTLVNPARPAFSVLLLGSWRKKIGIPGAG